MCFCLFVFLALSVGKGDFVHLLGFTIDFYNVLIDADIQIDYSLSLDVIYSFIYSITKPFIYV